MTVLAVILILVGLLFSTVAAVGVIRLPDFYTRSHAVGIIDTMGVMFILGGIAVYLGWTLVTVKLTFILFFTYLANPAIAHLLLRGALRAGLGPWIRKENQ